MPKKSQEGSNCQKQKLQESNYNFQELQEYSQNIPSQIGSINADIGARSTAGQRDQRLDFGLRHAVAYSNALSCGTQLPKKMKKKKKLPVVGPTSLDLLFLGIQVVGWVFWESIEYPTLKYTQ